MAKALLMALVIVGPVGKADEENLYKPVVFASKRMRKGPNSPQLLKLSLVIPHSENPERDFQLEAQAIWGKGCLSGYIADHSGFKWDTMSEIDEANLPDKFGAVYVLSIGQEALDLLMQHALQLELAAFSEAYLEELRSFDEGKEDVNKLSPCYHYMEPQELYLLRETTQFAWQEVA